MVEPGEYCPLNARLNNGRSLDLSNFDTSSVTNMRSMFSSASKLLALDTNGWDISNVTSSDQIFAYASPALVVSCNQGGLPGTGNFQLIINNLKNPKL